MSIYLDHAATTPLDPEALAAMEPYLHSDFGNPSSIHVLGQRARMAIDESREEMADMLGCHPSEIVFTSGGTESDNAAILGVVDRDHSNAHIVTTTIEHEAVLETCGHLERRGAQVAYAPADGDGRISVDAVTAGLRPETRLVSVMHANNEIGVIQPVEAIGTCCRERGIPFHCDAVQTFGTIPVHVKALGVDLLSISAHKFHGPKGVGCLYVRTGLEWHAQQLGGGQERTRRSGTENVAGIVGMAVAARKAVRLQSEANDRLRQMREYLFAKLLAPSSDSSDPPAYANGSRTERLPGNVNISFPGISGEAMVLALDREGVLASTGSACSSGSTEPSHVLLALYPDPARAKSALRLTLGRDNTWQEVETAAEIIAQTVSRLRRPEPVAFA